MEALNDPEYSLCLWALWCAIWSDVESKTESHCYMESILSFEPNLTSLDTATFKSPPDFMKLNLKHLNMITLNPWKCPPKSTSSSLSHWYFFTNPIYTSRKFWRNLVVSVNIVLALHCTHSVSLGCVNTRWRSWQLCFRGPHGWNVQRLYDQWQLATVCKESQEQPSWRKHRNPGIFRHPGCDP